MSIPRLTEGEVRKYAATDAVFRPGFRHLIAEVVRQVSRLGSQAANEGASLVAVRNALSHFTGTDLETVLEELYQAAITATSDTFTDTLTYYAVDQVGPAFAELGTQIGGLTSTTYTFTKGAGGKLADDDFLYPALNKLDQGFVNLAVAGGGVGTGAETVGIRDVGGLITATTADGALTEVKTDVNTIRAENVDGSQLLNLHGRTASIAGVWNENYDNVNRRFRWDRVADAGVTSLAINIDLPNRTTAARGRKLTGFRVVYDVNTADLDDVLFTLYQQAVPANGAVMAAAALLGGNLDAHYDVNHDTPAKRSAGAAGPIYHTATVTLPVAAYPAADAGFVLEVNVDGDAGGAGIFRLYSVVPLWSETLVD